MLTINNYKKLKECENIYSIVEHPNHYEIALITESWEYHYKTHTFLLNRYEIEDNGNIEYELFSKKFGGNVMIDIHTIRNSTKLVHKMEEYDEMNNRKAHYI
jgi:hypothetical protein